MELGKPKGRRADQLPPGRHGLAPEYVAASQRMRLLEAVVEAVAEKGYQETRVTDIIARAGVSRKTFYEHFDEKEECFLAAYELEVSQIVETAAGAFAGEGPRPWPEQLRDGVRAFLRYLAEHPAAARVCIVDVMGAGKKAIDRRDAALRSFTYFVDAGRSEADHEVPGRLALAILGGGYELIAAELIHGSAANLDRLAPDLVYLMTLPFLGPRRAFAEREKTRKEVESSRPASGGTRTRAKADGKRPAEGRARQRAGSISAAKAQRKTRPATGKRNPAPGGRAKER
jgi:AcrR family transcriptional regulator